ncbi:MAG: PSD1 and planctomycete cytochrome C domain-containing protein [Maribacter sp.]|nr:PSD1 and planctomycete cytochrome C domain-containing protein [Maribacter sp.]
MKKNALKLLVPFLILIGAVLLWNNLKTQEEVDFSADIKPILNKNCISCHGGVKKNGDFSVLFEEEALSTTESGRAAIIPGNASGSEMIKRIKSDDPELRMPYEKEKLSEGDIDLLTRWIDQGAKWGRHWAYSLPEKVEVPAITEEAGFSGLETSKFIQNGIDNFILRRLNNEGLIPNSSAEPNTIARRSALDITGLPPNKNLFNDYSNGKISYEMFVDSLLALPAFGEKWATWWLDMARYSDSKGYEKDQGRSIWEYRDWVIRALNKDMPYDQFTIEQLAGDLLPDPSIDQLIATAFHRNTMNNDEGGTDDEEFRVATVIDRVNTTFEVWQSTTMGCVQCHSHPYDPFKHENYYNLMAFFNNTRDEDIPSESPVLKFYSEEQQKEIDQVTNWVSEHSDAKVAKAYRNFLMYQQPVYNSHQFQDFVNGSYDDHASVVLWDDGSCRLENAWSGNTNNFLMNYRSGYENTLVTIRKENANGEILAQFKIGKTNGNTTLKVPCKPVKGNFNLYIETNNDNIPKKATAINIYWIGFLDELLGEDKAGYKQIEAIFMKLLNTRTPTVPIMIENPDHMLRTTHVFERGNWLLKADSVQPMVPEVISTWNDDWAKNRLGLAQWIVDRKNPLTARTVVNRVWHQLFGRGLVTIIEDIGSQSDPPTHPELLDWLSLRFMNEHNWSLKALIKDIVMSGTYRQSSVSTPGMYQIDPSNELYARGPRQRLAAEQIRDQALAVSGLLSTKMYGPGVMPPQPDGVWQTVYSGEKWLESKGEDRYRRAVYTYLKRTSPYPSFLTFDGGSREICTIRRTVTNTPLQALVTLNDPVYLEASYNLAKGMQVSQNVDENIVKGFEMATYSEISPEKLKALKELYQISLDEFESNKESIGQFLYFEENPNAKLAALTVVANAIMNLDEFLTKA